MIRISLQFFAHKKGVGSTKNGRDSESKRLGVKKADGANVVAEIESAGEEVVKTEADFKDYEYTAVDKMTKALMEVSSGTADAAVVDYVMSIGSIGEGTDYENLVVEGEGYAPENYGIAFRKADTDTIKKFNEAFAEMLNEDVDIKVEPFLTEEEAVDVFGKVLTMEGLNIVLPMVAKESPLNTYRYGKI